MHSEPSLLVEFVGRSGICCGAVIAGRRPTESHTDETRDVGLGVQLR